ncbi:hypothetical protein HN903_03210 [archaeon]|jgi:hypothetical protein|nr:hypothetical protein [archaeon]MBT7128739.1 hypothetical protein [archaeon]
MVMKKIKRVYWITKKVRKPVVIKFRRKDGTIAEFKATRIVKKPVKVVLKRIKKVYLK